MGNPTNVRVLPTPPWTPEQALLHALFGIEDVEDIYIVTTTRDRQWRVVLGGEPTVGTMLIATEILRREAALYLEPPACS